MVRNLGSITDGVLSEADAVFEVLRLWVDANHDGVSQPGEMSHLSASRVRSIKLDYIETRRRDQHGNWLRWASLVRFTQGAKLAAVDVIFVEE